MKFCKNCKEIMKIMGEGKFECPNCKSVEIGEISSTEKIIKKQKRKQGVVDDANLFATFDHVCKKCGYDKAQVIERAPYISDEDSLSYLKCGKCGWTENLAKKIG